MTKQYSAAERAGLAAWPRTSVTFERDAWVDFVGDLPPIADYARLCQDAETIRIADRSVLVQGRDDQIRCLTQLAHPRRAKLLLHLEAIHRLRHEL